MFLRADLSGVRVGLGEDIKVIGAINLSPESFYKGSIVRDPEEALQKAESMVEEGASIIDVGGMSTAPYLDTEVSAEEEVRRVVPVIKLLSNKLEVPISVDTQRSSVAKEAIDAGASIVNDVSGLSDPKMPELIADTGSSLILGAPREPFDPYSDPISQLRRFLSHALEKARNFGIPERRIVIDPLIGFFRSEIWYLWDCAVIRWLGGLFSLGRPICIGISRKSFIGRILGVERPEDRLIGSMAAVTLAVERGASLVRTHDVKETLQAVKIVEAIAGRPVKLNRDNVEVIELPPLRKPDAKDFLIRMGVHPVGADIMSDKARFYLLLFRRVKREVALIMKQELLACGGDTSLPKEIFDPERERVDIILMANRSQLKRLIEKLEMNASYASTLGEEFMNVSLLLKELIRMDNWFQE